MLMPHSWINDDNNFFFQIYRIISTNVKRKGNYSILISSAIAQQFVNIASVISSERKGNSSIPLIFFNPFGTDGYSSTATLYLIV